MRMIGLHLAAMALMLLLAGCAGRHVLFVQQSGVPDEPGWTNLFLDARGHLYPTGLSSADVDLEKHQGSLFEAAIDRENGVCPGAPAGTELSGLCAALPSECSDWSGWFDRWEVAQQALWRTRAQQITSAISGRPGSTLVMLIHGFNNTYDESRPRFVDAESLLTAHAPQGQKPHFVRVFWDGCSGSSTGVGCWGRAQATGPLVGFSLRQLLNSMEDSRADGGSGPPVRVLTHSSGAFVAGAMVGDPTAALPLLRDPYRNRRYQLFAQHASAGSGPYRVPQSLGLRIAMLAAATPHATFSRAPGGSGGVQARGIDLLISVHPQDRAITKLGVLGCRNFGASCLSARADDVCHLKASLRAAGHEARVLGYDFRRKPEIWGKETKSHDFAVYTRQASQNSTFFKDLMFAGGLGEGTIAPFPTISCP